MAVLVCSYSRR